MYVTKVDCVHDVCWRAMKFCNKVGYRTRKLIRSQNIFRKLERTISSYGGSSAPKGLESEKLV